MYCHSTKICPLQYYEKDYGGAAEDIEIWVEILLPALKYTAASGSEPRCILGPTGVSKK